MIWNEREWRERGTGGGEGVRGWRCSIFPPLCPPRGLNARWVVVLAGWSTVTDMKQYNQRLITSPAAQLNFMAYCGEEGG